MKPKKDFYPRPPRGGRRTNKFCNFRSQLISIHALREEGDVLRDTFDYDISISIHALREEGDKYRLLSGTLTFKFLSTPSARRATC